MILDKVGTGLVLRSTLLEQFKELGHAISTRVGGISMGAYDSLNLGFGLGDADTNVHRNRQLFCESIGADYPRLTLAHQVLGSQVTRVEPSMVGNGVPTPLKHRPACDALVTDQPGVPLLTLSGDCPLVLLYDPARRVIGNAHASRLGTQGEIAAKTAALMRDAYGCKPEDIFATIVPSIGPCCYEVGVDATAQLREKLLYADRFLKNVGGAMHLDLWGMNRYQLIEAGLCEEHIEMPTLCSRCNESFFYSYRRDGRQSGRYGAISWLK